MAEFINLRRARKAKLREEAEAKAAQNRALFGRSKAETASTAAERDRFNKTLDDAQVDRPPEE